MPVLYQHDVDFISPLNRLRISGLLCPRGFALLGMPAGNRNAEPAVFANRAGNVGRRRQCDRDVAGCYCVPCAR